MQILDRVGPTEEAAVLRPNADALAVLDDLSRPLEERLLGPIAAAGYKAPLPVLTERPAPLDVRHTTRGTTLTAADFPLDPQVTHERRGFVRAPESVRDKLKALEQHGIDPDRLWILREMPGHWRPGETPPRMIALETAERARSNHLLHLQAGATAFAVGKGLLYVAGGALVVATGVVVAAGALTVGAIGGRSDGPAGCRARPNPLGRHRRPEDGRGGLDGHRGLG